MNEYIPSSIGEINESQPTKYELNSLETEIKKTQYEQFCKNYPKIRMNFSYFCEYTKLFPLEKIGAESLAEICEKPIEPSYVNSCIRNKECLGEFYFSGKHIIDLYEHKISPYNIVKYRVFLAPNAEWQRKIDFLTFPYLESFVSYIEKNPQACFQIGSQKYPLTSKEENLQLFGNFFEFLKKSQLNMNEIPWEMAIENYQSQLNQYIEEGKKPIDKIFILSAKDTGTYDAYGHMKGMENIYRHFTKNVEVISEGTGVNKNTIIPQLEQYILSHPKENIIIHLGLHGNSQGETVFDQYFIQKSEIDRLRQLSEIYSVTLVVDSCYGGQKFSQLEKGNFLLTSMNDTSGNIGWIHSFFKEYKKQQTANLKEAFLHATLKTDMGYNLIVDSKNGI